MTHTDGLLFRPPVSTPESKGGAAPQFRSIVEAGMRIELDVPVRLRDGVTIYADVMRPLGDEPVPVLIGWGPYGKHVRNNPSRYRPGAMVPEHLSPRARFEAPNPDFWVPAGYAVISVDPRGTWYSEGRATFIADQEAEDFYDFIEWAGTQPWSSGKVGLSGVSYLAVSQWRVAGLKPPHLAAINPWEGWTDTYREVAFHGGIPDNYFWEFIAGRWSSSIHEVEDLIGETAAHPLYDTFWESKTARLADIEVPAFVVASWTDQGLHTRGTLEGFKQIRSTQKWLWVHGRKKWAHYYDPASLAMARVFFDHFLKGVDNEITQWPPVRLEVRERHFVGQDVTASSWPPAETRYRRLYLDATTGRLGDAPPTAAAQARYDPVDTAEPPARAEFVHTFAARTDVVGHMALHTWVQAEGAYDMDLFVGIKKRDAQGREVPFPFCAQFDDGPVALGWLRVSHRALDTERSTPQQPVLAHRRVMKLAEDEIVAVDVEIWPSGTRFEAGESLVLVIQGSEVCKHTALAHYRHTQTLNTGLHVVHTGPAHESYLLIPVLDAAR